MSLETFEDESDLATVFSVGGDPEFTASGALAVGFASGFFAGGSNYGLDTYVAGAQAAGPVGSITIATGHKFMFGAVKAAISDDYDLLTFIDGSIKFTGTLVGGGTATETITCNSSGGWQTLVPVGGLSGVWITSLEVEIVGGGVVYVGLDDFDYDYGDIPPPTDPPPPGNSGLSKSSGSVSDSGGSGGSGGGSGSGGGGGGGGDSGSGSGERVPLNTSFVIYWCWEGNMSVNHHAEFVTVVDDVATTTFWSVTHNGDGTWDLRLGGTLYATITDGLAASSGYAATSSPMGWLYIGDLPPDPLPPDP